jgi:hypothetical protein
MRRHHQDIMSLKPSWNEVVGTPTHKLQLPNNHGKKIGYKELICYHVPSDFKPAELNLCVASLQQTLNNVRQKRKQGQLIGWKENLLNSLNVGIFH